ncbi:MAG: ROK family protein [Bauldia sp.]|nr:ROK family protein [Bauldia sp.]
MTLEHDTLGLPILEGARQQRRPQRIDGEHFSLALILNLIRSGQATTRLEIERQSGLGRAVVIDRLATLMERGLVAEGDLGPTTGGRAPRNFRFRSEAGMLLVAVLGPSTVGVALADLSGRLRIEHHESIDMSVGPALVLRRLQTLFDWIIDQQDQSSREVWGIGLAVSTPVSPAPTGLLSAATLPSVPGWADFPFTQHLAVRYGAPVWVGNRIHMMALGEQRAGSGVGVNDMVFVHLGRQIGAGIITEGRLHSGAQGGAGLIGHIATGDDNRAICRCGNVGCLETVAGTDAIVRQALQAAQDGRSAMLADSVAASRGIDVAEVGSAAQSGDAFCAELMSRCGRQVGTALSAVVNTFNPSLIILGGAIAQTSDMLIAAIREGIFRKSHPLLSRDLRIARSQMGSSAALVGASMTIVDDLLSTPSISLWVDDGSPLAHSTVANILALSKQTISMNEPRPAPPEPPAPRRRSLRP